MVEDQNLSVEQKLTKARLWIISRADWRYMASVVTLGTVTVVDADDKTKTASTDGLNEIYNRGFVSTLTREQIRFLVLHENMHKLFRHLNVWVELYKKDAQRANIAMDAIINNQYLNGKEGLAFIPGGVDMPKYKDSGVWNTRKVFDDLPESDGEGGGSLDDHKWEDAVERSDDENKELEAQIDSALRQAALAGHLDGNSPRGIQEMLVPEVDWREALAEFVKRQCTGFDKQSWRRPNKNYLPYDLYLPTLYSEQLGRILLAVDTSGSIDDRALSVFLGHAQHLCDEVQPDGVDVVWWGTSVGGVDRFSRAEVTNLASAVKPRGGGGTSPECIPKWLQTEKDPNYVCAVVLTDGEFYGDGVGDWGDLPVLWLVVNDQKQSDIPVGVTINVKELK